MLTLLRKDLRLLRPALIGVGLLAITFYVALPLLNLDRWTRGARTFNYGFPVGYVGSLFQAYMLDSEPIMLPALLAATAVVAGWALAGERQRHTAEFVAILPVSRRRTVAVKLGVALGLAVAFYAMVLAARYVAEWFAYPTAPANWTRDWIPFTFDWPWEMARLDGFLATETAVFGAGWLASSLLRSPVVAASIAAAAGGAYLSTLQQTFNAKSHATLFVTDVLRGQAGFGGQPAYSLLRAFASLRPTPEVLAVLLGVAAVVAGTIVQTRRVSP